MYSCGPPHMDVQEWDDQHELTYSSYVRTRDVTLKTCRRRWMIGRNGERRSGISAQTARHDDDDDIYYNLTLSNATAKPLKNKWSRIVYWTFKRFNVLIDLYWFKIFFVNKSKPKKSTPLLNIERKRLDRIRKKK